MEYIMANNLPQKYQEVAKALIPYGPQAEETIGQMALMTIDPALPCFICGLPATIALIAPAKDYELDHRKPWLTFPICSACEERQITR
jgi:hypothetical protein